MIEMSGACSSVTIVSRLRRSESEWRGIAARHGNCHGDSHRCG